MTDRSRTHPVVERLRRAFDDAFAAPAELPVRDVERLLAIRVGGEPFAIRVLETTGLLATRKIVPMPSRRPELLGLTGIRGAVIPVFGLAGLLRRGPTSDDARWMVLCGREQPAALAFGTFEGHVEVPRADIHVAAEGASGHVREIVTAAGQPWPLISIPSVMRDIAGPDREEE